MLDKVNQLNCNKFVKFLTDNFLFVVNYFNS